MVNAKEREVEIWDPLETNYGQLTYRATLQPSLLWTWFGTHVKREDVRTQPDIRTLVVVY